MMALTKNYYVAEEVRAALSYACKERRQADAVFWCQELVVSNMSAAALETLYDCWLWTYGPCRIHWLWAAQATEENRLPRLAQTLAALERDAQDSSMWVILRETKGQPDRVGHGPSRSAQLASMACGQKAADRVVGEKSTGATLATYFTACCQQSKTAAAWWAAAQLGLDETVRLATAVWPDRALWLQTVLACGLPEKARHCLIACCASMWPAAWEASVRALPRPPEIPYGPSTKGPRACRALAIPRICLYGITARGRMRQTESTAGALRDIEPSLVGLYWDSVLGVYKRTADGHIIWSSDAALEAFYAKHFPDDIPDEWSLADQEKSHGAGVLGPTETVGTGKLARIWLPRRQRLCWLEAAEEEVTGSLAAMALEGEPVAAETDRLTPVKKIVRGS